MMIEDQGEKVIIAETDHLQRVSLNHHTFIRQPIRQHHQVGHHTGNTKVNMKVQVGIDHDIGLHQEDPGVEQGRRYGEYMMEGMTYLCPEGPYRMADLIQPVILIA